MLQDNSGDTFFFKKKVSILNGPSFLNPLLAIGGPGILPKKFLKYEVLSGELW